MTISKSRSPSVLVERVNLRALLGASIIAGVGLVLLYYAGDNEWWKGFERYQAFLREIGALLLATAILTTAWDVYGKRAFLDEILAKSQISTDIKDSGLVRITPNFSDGIDWKSHLNTVNKLDLLFAYARSWRNTNADGLRAVASRRGARIRVMLPDPEDDLTISSIAQRFGWEKEKLLGLVWESAEFYKGLQGIAGEGGAKVEVWFLRGVPQFTFYRFDSIIVFTLNSHRRELVSIPTFVCESGGDLYKYIRDEFERMVDTGSDRPALARKYC